MEITKYIGIQMKKSLIILLLFVSTYSFSQREYSTADITGIQTGQNASEGDFYKDTTLNILYIGLTDGTLWRVVDTDTDNQDLQLSGNTLSLTNDATTVDLTPYLDNTDNQSITNFSLTGSTLSITIEDGNTQNVDIATADSTIYKYDGFLRGNRTMSMNGYNLNLSGTKNFIFQDDGKFGINSSTATSAITIRNEENDDLKDDLEIITHNTDAINAPGIVLKSGRGTLASPANSVYGDRIGNYGFYPMVNGTYDRLSSVRAFYRGDGTTSLSDLIFETSNIHRMVIDSIGNVGIGTEDPETRLHVAGGNMKLSNYGAGSITGTDTYLLGVDATGNVVEVNTTTSSKIFYPPAMVIDVSMTGTGLTLDLHQEYVNRYGTPSVKSPSAPAAIPTYIETELHYYITDYDVTVFDNVSVSDAGIMTYDVISVPASNCTYVNVVFVVK